MKTIERMSIVQQVIGNLISYMEDNHCQAGGQDARQRKKYVKCWE